MSTAFEINDLHDELSRRDELLRANNASARETSLLSRERFDHLISAARVALFVKPAAAFLLAFEQSDDYDGGHFLWFRSRFDKFLYIDRVVVTEEHRRHGLGRMLYADVFKRAIELGHPRVVCEVNLQPPNPGSEKFHAAQGFEEVGRATIDYGAKTVRYLAANLQIPSKHLSGQGDATESCRSWPRLRQMERAAAGAALRCTLLSSAAICGADPQTE